MEIKVSVRRSTPVTTSPLRLEGADRPGWPGGVHEHVEGAPARADATRDWAQLPTC